MRQVTQAGLGHAAARTLDALCPDCLDRTFGCPSSLRSCNLTDRGSAHIFARSVAAGGQFEVGHGQAGSSEVFELRTIDVSIERAIGSLTGTSSYGVAQQLDVFRSRRHRRTATAARRRSAPATFSGGLSMIVHGVPSWVSTQGVSDGSDHFLTRIGEGPGTHLPADFGIIVCFQWPLVARRDRIMATATIKTHR